jgi:hypothetical protein
VLIPEPCRADYPDDATYREAVATAASNRIESMRDTLAGLLDWGFRQEERKINALLTSACAQVGGAYGEDPWAYVDAIKQRGELGREVAELLTAQSQMRGAALVFPKPGTQVDPGKATSLLDRATFTVISTHGLAQPPAGNSDRNTWTPAQQLTPSILHQVANLATLAMYQDRDELVNITVDELRLIASVGSAFTSWLNRTTVDSRKWSAHVGLLFQAPRMITDLDASIANLAGSVFVGRSRAEDAKAAKVLLGDEVEGSGLEDTLVDLAAGEFMVRDWLGRRRLVYVDRSWWPEPLFKALDTTPGQRGAYDDSPSRLFGVPA